MSAPGPGTRPRSARPATQAVAPVPASGSLATLRRAAAGCHACPLWRCATQTVFGVGRRGARTILIGEQPGDHEDRVGRPFVGPAGKLLDRALVAAGVDRAQVYITNAVKHFKWVSRGPRRLHQKPNAREIAACHPWLQAEVEAIAPDILVCLGATAARSVFGRPVPVLKHRGQIRETPFGVPALVTIHPSALLRLRDRAEAQKAFAQFVKDLRQLGSSEI